MILIENSSGGCSPSSAQFTQSDNEMSHFTFISTGTRLGKYLTHMHTIVLELHFIERELGRVDSFYSSRRGYMSFALHSALCHNGCRLKYEASEAFSSGTVRCHWWETHAALTGTRFVICSGNGYGTSACSGMRMYFKNNKVILLLTTAMMTKNAASSSGATD